MAIFQGSIDGNCGNPLNWTRDDGVTPLVNTVDYNIVGGVLVLTVAGGVGAINSQISSGSFTTQTSADTQGNNVTAGTITCGTTFTCGENAGGETITATIIAPAGIILTNNAAQTTLTGCTITGNVTGAGGIPVAGVITSNTITGKVNLADGQFQNLQCTSNTISGLATISTQSNGVISNNFNGGLTTDSGTLENSIIAGNDIISSNTIPTTAPLMITGYGAGTLYNLKAANLPAQSDVRKPVLYGPGNDMTGSLVASTPYRSRGRI